MIESTSGRWIAEFGELPCTGKGEVEKIKTQPSRQTKRARLAYGKLPGGKGEIPPGGRTCSNIVEPV
jgi:predicted P-loop ATPase